MSFIERVWSVRDAEESKGPAGSYKINRSET
ncbi:hypothetical protein ABH944_000650 [Caballeronia udeis]|jgi:hypothetical protein|uniref:Uncharacterized protein n=1 Tax=Caballeronia udeis TaxID=1232866 RepID=A0ABW8MBD0_9BURK